VFQAPASNADKKAAKDARKREKEAVKEKARKKAEAAAAEAEANKGETPEEKKTRLAREAKVKQMLFNLDQEAGNTFFTATYKRLAVRAPHFCRAPVRLPTTLLAPQILDVIVMFTYMVYLIFVYPAREPTFAKNSTTEMLAPVRDRPCVARQPEYFPSACCFSQARPWFPFAAVTFALLAVIGNLVNLLSLLTVRAVIGFKGVKSPALLPIAKGTTYTLYIGVWISFQSTISGITRAGDVIERLNNDIGTISPIQTIFSIISLVTTFLLTPIQLAQIVQSYGILYKGLLPIVSINQALFARHRYPCTHTTT